MLNHDNIDTQPLLNWSKQEGKWENYHVYTRRRRSALKKLQGCRWNKLWALALGVLLLALSGLLTVTLVYALARQVPFDVSTRSHARFYFTTNDARCTRLM
ncbi:Hypothetical predicted protein [Cloeon dipterum]|uniref:Uncharacterized protein n=1 Tax=Cloeon dipterum TaxID=197152 RepID=A0A8S1C814_9INSE|nr:Hypothetical predicted protein [Cloeon dipterum]